MTRGRAARRLPLVLLCLLWLGGCTASRNYEALLALADVAAGTGPSRLKEITAEPALSTVTYQEGEKRFNADLYLPVDAPAAGAIVLVPGAVPEGKDDQRLVALAKTLARVRFAVLAPELSGYRELKIGPQHAAELAAAVRYLSSQPQWAPAHRVGIAAFSYGAGPALSVALDKATADLVGFVLAIGPYYDLNNAIRFFTTGVFLAHGTPQLTQASEYGKLVFVRSTLDLLVATRDRELLRAMTEARLHDPQADIARSAGELGPEGRAVFELMENRDPTRTLALIAALPAAVRQRLEQLSLADKPFGNLQAHLILVHGKDDRLIPYTESEALRRAAPEGKATMFLIERILSHVDLGFSGVFSRRFWTEEAPDAWRMWRAQALLLKERDRLSQAQRPLPGQVAPGR